MRGVSTSKASFVMYIGFGEGQIRDQPLFSNMILTCYEIRDNACKAFGAI